MKEFFKNHYLKILSLFIALVLWFISTNIFNPQTKEVFKGIPITLKNLTSLQEHNFILGNIVELESKTVDITIHGFKNDLDKLALAKNRERIMAIVDFKPINVYSADSSIVTIKYELPAEFDATCEIIRKSESEVKISLDRKQTVSMKLNVNFSGEVPEGYRQENPILEPETVYVTAGKSEINKISEIAVKIDLDGKTEDIIVNKVPAIYDIDGNDITEAFELDVGNVSVRVPIFKSKKILILPTTHIGEPSDGFVLVESTRDPISIEIYGNAEEIDSIESIDLGEFDIEGATGDLAFDVYLPQKLSEMGKKVNISKVSDHEVKVVFKIEELVQREISVPLSQITVNSGENEVEFESEEITMVVIGRKSIVDTIDISALKGTLDVSTLDEGTHEILVNLSLPDESQGVKVEKPPKIIINIIKQDSDFPINTTEPTTNRTQRQQNLRQQNLRQSQNKISKQNNLSVLESFNTLFIF